MTSLFRSLFSKGETSPKALPFIQEDTHAQAPSQPEVSETSTPPTVTVEEFPQAPPFYQEESSPKSHTVSVGNLEAFQNFQDAIQINDALMEFDSNAAIPEIEVENFDFFKITGEWLALKQEVKQQTKAQNNTLSTLNKSIELVESLRQRLEAEEIAHQQKFVELEKTISGQLESRKEQEFKTLFKELIAAVDSLDYAIDHWKTSSHEDHKWWHFRGKENLGKILESGIHGLELIRERLWNLMANHEVEPYETVGEKFDPSTMTAVDQHSVQDDDEANKVYSRVLRGYRWKGQIFRLSEVVVTVKQKTMN
ncbi:MAG: nucleotide exchange factor GrpE [SAR324 cluster bacterium]|nr:nucleotide exchange factor GrpE [SAR324 cluster bacterium]